MVPVHEGGNKMFKFFDLCTGFGLKILLLNPGVIDSDHSTVM